MVDILSVVRVGGGPHWLDFGRCVWLKLELRIDVDLETLNC